jgi:hypothetical protein
MTESGVSCSCKARTYHSPILKLRCVRAWSTHHAVQTANKASSQRRSRMVNRRRMTRILETETDYGEAAIAFVAADRR